MHGHWSWQLEFVPGAPLQKEDLGETEIPLEVFNDYLKTHAQDRSGFLTRRTEEIEKL